MARKSKKVNKAANILMSDSLYGQEPTVPTDREMTDFELLRSLNWYGYNSDAAHAKKFLKTYLAAAGEHNGVVRLKTVPDNRIILTGAWLARIVLLGGKLPNRSVVFMLKKIDETLSYSIQEVEEEKEKAYVPNIQERIREKNSEFIGELLGAIDDGLPADWSCYEYLKQKNASPLQARAIVNKLTDQALELADTLDTKDIDLKYAYRGYKKKELEHLTDLYAGIIVDADRYADTHKKIRAPRKKKAPSVEKLLKSFKYSRGIERYKIASIDPVKVIGSQVLYMFNSKNNVLTILKALDRGGLSIKGTTIIGFDPNTSYSKTIGRKTQETLDMVLNSGKVALRKLQDKPARSTRTNDATVLLKVEK